VGTLPLPSCPPPAQKQTYLFIYIQHVDCHPPGKFCHCIPVQARGHAQITIIWSEVLKKQYSTPIRLFLIYSQMSSLGLFNCGTLALDSEFLSQAGGSRCVHIYYSTLVCVKRASPSTRTPPPTMSYHTDIYGHAAAAPPIRELVASNFHLPLIPTVVSPLRLHIPPLVG